MIDYKKTIVMLVLLSVVLFGAISFMNDINSNQQTNLNHTESNYEQFVSSELKDKCAVPDGYDEETWKQHMSHHPERYEGCDF